MAQAVAGLIGGTRVKKHRWTLYGLRLGNPVYVLGQTKPRPSSDIQAEGLDGIINGYANLHLLPMYQKKIAYGLNGFPWNSEFVQREINYTKGICPVAEELHHNTFIGFEICRFQLSDTEIKQVLEVFRKVWKNL